MTFKTMVMKVKDNFINLSNSSTDNFSISNKKLVVYFFLRLKRIKFLIVLNKNVKN